MKKNLRMLFLGLAAATFSASFAQDNVTDKLINADLSKGVLGWDITFESNLWQKQQKGQASYHGFNGVCIQNWKSDATTGLTNSSISQTLKNMPNGTYVFGAYLAAAKKDSVENREQVTGVYLYANEVAAPVATNWPEHTSQKWSHSAKFNVAATVTDGTLTVGIKNEETNANYIIWDNATLYFFGNTDAEAALNEMAKIDLAASVALADTCKAHAMNVDTLAALDAAIEAAKTVTGVEGAYEADENLWWAFRQARASLNDYRGLNNAVANAKAVAAKEWSAMVADAVAALNDLIGSAEETYTAATADRAAINALKTDLSEAAAYVELDSAYTKIDELTEKVDEIEPGKDLGDYSEDMLDEIDYLLEQVGEVLGESEDGLAATVAKHRCDSLFALIDDIFANPISYDAFPIVINKGAQRIDGIGYDLIAGATKNEAGVVTYTSKTYRFQYPLNKVRFIIRETGSNGLNGNYPFVTLSAFEMYDEKGNEIELSESDITSNACHNTLNPGSPDGQGIPGLIDDDPNTFFHSTWGVTVNEPHYLEVTLPEGQYSAFSFSMTARGTSHPHQFPRVLEITYISDAVDALTSAIGAAQAINPYAGTTPGFYNTDLAPFKAALAEAEALMNTDASDDVILAAIGKLEEEQGKLEEVGLVMPDPAKKYRIISATPNFINKQNKNVAITTHSDTTYTDWLWWEVASADSAQQLFSFEPIENEDGKYLFAIKHDKTGKYIGSLLDEDGDPVSNAVGLNAEKDTVELKPLGFGQFGLMHDGQLHVGDHNSGVVSTSKGAYGGIYGVSSSLVKWTSGANDNSAWHIREVVELPHAAKSISDINFQSDLVALYEGVNTLTLTADKNCAFADLVVYNYLGEVIPASVSKNGAVATVVLDTTVVDAFKFSFTNTESVATVTINGLISKLSVLQDRYDAALANAPVIGDQIGQVQDVAEYEAALAAAEKLLVSGGSDEDIELACAAIDSALAHIEINLPAADKEYLILSALPAFKETHWVDMAIYAKEDAPAWTYVSANNPVYRWKFVEGDLSSKGVRTFFVQNVGNEKYIGISGYLSTALTMEAEKSSTDSYRVDAWGTNDLGVSEVTLCHHPTSNGNIHFNGHSGGASTSGNIVYWSSTSGTASSLRIVEAEAYIQELIDGIEDVEFVDEYVAPAKKGIYDLYGRRIEAPAVTGIYVVDGKKRVIKK